MDDRPARLRALIGSPALSFLMEAHSALSARIVEAAGFEGIWASGLTISASLGLRDCNEASWTQTLEVLEFMADAVRVPILVDGDTGHGNFNNARRYVRKLEQRGAAGVCLEDKVFPKSNSLIDGGRHALADASEFAGRIRAAADARRNDGFVIVARTEALVVGAGLSEALRRAETYCRAGADAILIHSARAEASEVLAFKRAWGSTVPVLAVPTTYARTPTEVFRSHGFSTLIWANHVLRASVTAMQKTAARLFAAQSIAAIERDIAPLDEIFWLQDIEELREAERRYLPVPDPPLLKLA